MGAPARYRVGEFDIAVVSDGTFKLDAGAVFGVVPRVVWEPILGSNGLDGQHRMTLGLNCMLVRRGDDLLLIETGMGDKLEGVARERTFVGEYGKLINELASIGVQPGDVTHVVNTHLHGDHCGWNTRREGDRLVPTFPNARYYAQAEEYELATHPNERTRAAYFAENFAPLVEANQLELVDGEREIVRGVQFVPTPGHTSGHASVILSSGTESAIYVGDVAHHEAQFERPAWISAYDLLPLVNLETKKKLFDRAVRERSLLICVHNSFPGVGRLTEQDGHRKFIPE